MRIKNDMKQYGKQSLFNTFGSLIYLFSQWLLTVITTRVAGFEQAGLLTLAISVGNIILFFEQYGGRNYQVSDVSEKYSLNDYITLRYITVSASILAAPVILLICGYKGERFAVILAFTLYRTFEAVSEVYFGELQKRSRLDLFAVSMTIKSVISTILFLFILKETGSLSMALLSMAIVAALVTVLLDFKYLKNVCGLETIQLTLKNTRRLLFECFGIFLCSILPIIETSFPRIILEKYYDAELLGYYGDVSTPTVLITAIVPSLLIPVMTLYAELIRDNKTKNVFKGFAVSLLVTAGLCVICMTGVVLLGKPVMSLIYTDQILPYIKYLYPLLISTTISAMTTCANSVLICFRKNKQMIICSVSGVAVCIPISLYMVSRYAIKGIIISLIISYGTQLLLQFGFIMSIALQKNKKTNVI